MPLVLQDKTFRAPQPDQRNDLYYPAPWEPEFFVNVPVVNGKVRPYLDVDRAVEPTSRTGSLASTSGTATSSTTRTTR